MEYVVAASLLTGGIFSAPVVHAEAHVDNPFVGATAYVNPDYTKEVNSSIAKVSNAALKAKMAIVKSYPTSVWLDSIGAIGGGAKNAGRLGLIAHLDAALAQKKTNQPITVSFVIYDIPGRDCHALASNGELPLTPEGLQRYKKEYIDVIAGIFANPKYKDIRIVNVIEPDGLPNLVTNLESLTQVIHESSADDGGSKREERAMDIEPSFETNAYLSKAGKPSVRALNHPPVTAQALPALDALAGDPGPYAAPLQILPTSAAVVSLVGMQLVGALTRPAIQATYRGNRIQGGFECDRVMSIRPCYGDGQGNASGIDYEVPLAPEFAAIRRARPGLFAPRGLGTLAPSILARLQSIWSCSRSRTSMARCSLSHTPPACQSRRRRQQVMPLPKPSSWGRSSHGIPVCNTYRMPLNAARSSTERRRPPLGEATNSGISGSSANHNSLLTFLLDMPRTITRFLP